MIWQYMGEWGNIREKNHRNECIEKKNRCSPGHWGTRHTGLRILTMKLEISVISKIREKMVYEEEEKKMTQHNHNWRIYRRGKKQATEWFSNR